MTRFEAFNREMCWRAEKSISENCEREEGVYPMLFMWKILSVVSIVMANWSGVRQYILRAAGVAGAASFISNGLFWLNHATLHDIKEALSAAFCTLAG